MIVKQFKFGILCAAALFLTGCGGGADSATPQAKHSPAPSTNASPAKFAATLGSYAKNLDEHTQISVPFSLSGAKGNVSVSAELTGGQTELFLVDVDTSGGNILISAKELDRDVALEVTVTFTDENNQSQTLNVPLTAINTSGLEAVNTLSTAAADVPRFIMLSAEKELLRRANALRTMVDGDPASDAGELLEQAIDPHYQARLEHWAEEYETYIAQYQAGSIGESALVDLTDMLLDDAAQFVFAVNAVLNAALASNELIATLPLGKVYIDKDSGRLSQFIGNPALGEYDNSRWIFGNEHDFLTAIVFPASTLCNVS